MTKLQMWYVQCYPIIQFYMQSSILITIHRLQQAAMETWMNHGAPANKLVLGIPSFGRTFVLVDPKQTDINSPACGDPDEGEYTRYPGYLSYYEVRM